LVVSEKALAWLGSALDDLRAFPKDARREAGYQLGRVQQGLLPTDWKAMARIGPGVIEIRVHTRVEHRVFYIAKFEEAVYVIHAFEKRTRQTPQSDVALAQKRLADLIRRRTKKPEAP
jgi:phage-related protein